MPEELRYVPFYHWRLVREIVRRSSAGSVELSESKGWLFRTFTFSGEPMAAYRARRAVEKELRY